MGQIVGTPHLQVKIFDNEEVLNKFLANRPESDIVSVTPFLINTEAYLGMRFVVVYKVL